MMGLCPVCRNQMNWYVKDEKLFWRCPYCHEEVEGTDATSLRILRSKINAGKEVSQQ